MFRIQSSRRKDKFLMKKIISLILSLVVVLSLSFTNVFAWNSSYWSLTGNLGLQYGNASIGCDSNVYCLIYMEAKVRDVATGKIVWTNTAGWNGALSGTYISLPSLSGTYVYSTGVAKATESGFGELVRGYLYFN